MRTVIECVPNISEGRNPEVVSEIAAAVRSAPGVRLLDVSSDPAHNRSVLTFVADGPRRAGGRTGSVRRRHSADRSHPPPRRAPPDGRGGRRSGDPDPGRHGRGVRRALARDRGRDRESAIGIPVYLYEDSATCRDAGATSPRSARGSSRGSPRRCRLPEWKPDFGPDAPHPTAGVVAVGARAPLIAYNINLGDARPRRRRSHREGDPAPRRRLPVREGAAGRARRPRAGPGLDQHDELQEEPAPPGVRVREVRGGAPRRRDRRLGDRRPDSGRGALHGR